ncbi:oxoglutarate-dependent flavonoid 7-O-demethylase 1-like [Aristolochia californica]|uniref:oxoglutarate-dependent flavonoid 7-O-demethylase 1-like n=1 Tax=Aristolochia californica TaxID=171875 RepID=UPI0035DC3902
MASPVQVTFGGSVPVPNVQELAKIWLDHIPPRFVRTDQEGPFISADSSLPTIPVIDMQSLLHGGNGSSEFERLRSACTNWGFFQLINHGMSSAVIEKMKREVEDFFKLPLAEKQKVAQHPDDAEGYGQTFITSHEQKLNWADMLFVTTNPANMIKPRICDNLPKSLIEAMEAYTSGLRKLGLTILERLAEALGMAVGEMRELFEDGYEGLRMNYYPPCPRPDLAIGSHIHSDTTGLTILLQVNETNGLQVRHGGKWVPVKPLPDAFIVNIGDMLEIISNGEYHSVEHRATVNMDHHRISLAMFFNPKLAAEIGPARSLISPGIAPQFKRITVEEFFKDFFAQLIKGKSFVESMRIKNLA